MGHKTKLIPGFRFHPTDLELVLYFLKRKVVGKKVEVIAEVNIYKYAPWDLPDKSNMRTGDLEWYFFCPTGKKYASGPRMNRATEIGYWKTTGRDRPIEYKNKTVGMIKTLVFHTGRAPRGDRTDWVMHEYRLEDEDLMDKKILQDSYVICKVFQKDGLGPRNGAQYGKPFNEEEWDSEDEEVDCVESVPLAALLAPVPILPITHSSFVATDMHLPGSGCIGSSSVSCLSGAMPCLMHPSVPSGQVISDEVSLVPVDNDLSMMLDSFTEDNTLAMYENSNILSGATPCLMHPSVPSGQVISNEVSLVPVDNDLFTMLDSFTEDNTLALDENSNILVNNLGQAESAPFLEVNYIFKDLGDFNNLAGWGEDGHHFFCGQKAEYTKDHILLAGDVSNGLCGPGFLELLDLDLPLFSQTEQHECWVPSDPEKEGWKMDIGGTEK